MSKKKKSKTSPEAGAQLEPASAPTLEAPEVAEESQAAPAEDVQQPEETMHLQDAARRFVVDYKEHWYPSIEKFANAQGMHKLEDVTWKMKDILKGWGAKLLE